MDIEDEQDEPRGPGRREITRELYDRLLQAFREIPGNASHAARQAGCDRRLAARAWARGWTDERSSPRLPWGRAIEEVLTMEKAALRRQLVHDAQRKSELDEAAYEAEMREALRVAQKDLAASRALIGKTVRQARHNAAHLLSASSRLLKAVLPLADRIEDLLASGQWKPTVKEASKLVKDIAYIARAATANAKETDEMERRALGEPDMFVGVALSQSMSVEEAVHEIEEARRAVERVQSRAAVIDVETSEPRKSADEATR